MADISHPAPDDSATRHLPVMLDEVIEALRPKPPMRILDGTVGGGGHARALARRLVPGGTLIGVDRDPAAIARSAKRLHDLPVELVHAAYDEVEQRGFVTATSLDGILLDLGLSTDQLADRERGFSYESEGRLDLRFDPTTGEAAWELLARVSERELADIIYRFGEERFSRRIARRIVEARRRVPIRTAAQLAQLVRGTVRRSRGHSIDPATRTFQALRIAVNDELRRLERALQQMPDWLKPGGRIAVISFHSLEDRIVKHAFRSDDRLEVLTKKPLRATREEQSANPKSRSAKLRVAERVSGGEVGG